MSIPLEVVKKLESIVLELETENRELRKELQYFKDETLKHAKENEGHGYRSPQTPANSPINYIVPIK